MKAVATVNRYYTGAVNRDEIKHSQTLTQCKKILVKRAAQRYAEFAGDETQYASGTLGV